jgi:hypothetical protein
MVLQPGNLGLLMQFAMIRFLHSISGLYLDKHQDGVGFS